MINSNHRNSRVVFEIKSLETEASKFALHAIAQINDRTDYLHQVEFFCEEVQGQAEGGKITAHEASWKAQAMRAHIRKALGLALSDPEQVAAEAPIDAAAGAEEKHAHYGRLLDNRASHFFSPAGKELSDSTSDYAIRRLMRPEETLTQGSRLSVPAEKPEEDDPDEAVAEEKQEDRLTIFANGYIIKQQLDAMDLLMVGTAPVPVYTKPYPPPIEIFRSDPVYDGERYWGTIEGFFKLGFKDYNAVFFNGSNMNDSQASDRMQRGKLAAGILDEAIQSGKVKFDRRGEVKIVGHSQGAAYAAGLAQALSGLGYKIITMWYLAPHQPGDIDHPAGIPAMQLSRWSDKVATVGLAKYRKISGGSELKQIPGVQLDVLEDMEAGRGGHSVWTYTTAIRTYYEQHGKSLLLN
jgi:hypothetical protein